MSSPFASVSVTVYLGLGTNLHRSSNLKAGLDGISQLIRGLEISPVFVSEAVGLRAELFFNLVVCGHCELSLKELLDRIKSIEASTGRDRRGAAVSLDIDVLMYGNSEGTEEGLELPSPEITTAAHVLYPLSLLAGNERYPKLDKTFSQMWEDFHQPSRIWPIPFVWRGSELTPPSALIVTSHQPPREQPTHYVCGQAVY